MLYKRHNPSIKLKHLLFVRALIRKRDLHSFVQKSEFPHTCRQCFKAQIHAAGKDCRIRLKSNLCTCFVAFTYYGDLAGCMALFISLMIHLTVSADFYFKPFGQGIDNAHANPVQAPRDLIHPVIELTACVQSGQHNLHRRLFLFFMHVYGNTPAVIGYGNTVVCVYHNIDIGTIARHCLINAIVSNLIDQVVQASCAGIADIHGGPLPHSLDTLEHLYLGSVVLCVL